MYTYGLPQWLMFFYLYCFAGWIFESAYVTLRTKHFVNRGFLRAPMLPLYGTGAVVMLWVSIPVRGNLVLTYLAGVVGATALEYVVGVGMEALFKVKYWDYSDQKLNFQGIICLSSSVAWGFLTLFLTEVIHRPVERWVLELPDLTLGIFLGSVSTVFVSDTIVSVKAALDLRKMLESMTRVRAEVEAMQVQLSLARMETRDQVEEFRETIEERMRRYKEAKRKFTERLEALHIPTRAQLDELKELLPDHSSLLEKLREKALEYNRIADRPGFFRESLLRGNPGASSMKFGMALKELQGRIKERTKDQEIKGEEDSEK